MLVGSQFHSSVFVLENSVVMRFCSKRFVVFDSEARQSGEHQYDSKGISGSNKYGL